MIRLAQLVFFLTVLFAAFLGGLAIGWMRWGRRPEREDTHDLRWVPRPRLATPHTVKSDLFAPESDTDGLTDASMFTPAELAPVRPADRTEP
jgi:hypothetical protein